MQALELTSSLTLSLKPSARQPRAITSQTRSHGDTYRPLNRNNTYFYIFVKTFQQQLPTSDGPMSEQYPTIPQCAAVAAALKVLLWPS